jgi:hypothetical protein
MPVVVARRVAAEFKRIRILSIIHRDIEDEKAYDAGLLYEGINLITIV